MTPDTRERSDQLFQAMIRCDHPGAMSCVQEALEAGIDPGQVIEAILDPALERIGQAWAAESVSLAQAYIAGKIAEESLNRCLPADGAPVATRGVIGIGNIEDDFHSLGRRIVGAFLRASGWEVHDLGNDVPAALFIERALEVGASVIGVSAMMRTTALNIRRLRDEIDARGLNGRLKMAVGGAVFNWRPEMVAEVGGDGMAPNAAAADALCRRLQAEARGEAIP